MSTRLDAPADLATDSSARPLRAILPGAAALLYAGIQLDAGIMVSVYGGISTVSEDRLNFPFSGSLATATSLTWMASQVLFVIALVAFARSGAVGRSRAGLIGARVTVVGGLVFVAAHAVSVIFRDARMDDPQGVTAIVLFAGGSMLTAVGFIVSGVAVMRAGRWTGWRRYPALAVGAWMICMVPLQFTGLLPVAVAVYGATVVAFAVALLSEPEDLRP